MHHMCSTIAAKIWYPVVLRSATNWKPCPSRSSLHRARRFQSSSRRVLLPLRTYSTAWPHLAAKLDRGNRRRARHSIGQIVASPAVLQLATRRPLEAPGSNLPGHRRVGRLNVNGVCNSNFLSPHCDPFFRIYVQSRPRARTPVE